MRIVFDTDGVKRNILSETLIVYKREFDQDCTLKCEDIIHYDLRQLTKLKDKRDIFIPFAEEIFLNAKMYDENLPKIILNLKNREHKIIFASDQYPEVEKYTDMWYEKNNLYFDEKHYTKEKYNLKADVLIEDFDETLYKARQKRMFGICMNRPYNQMWDGIRIDSINKLEVKISEIEELKGYKK